MRYWTFDVCSLIADYDNNKRRLASILEAKKVAQKIYRKPHRRDEQGGLGAVQGNT